MTGSWASPPSPVSHTVMLHIEWYIINYKLFIIDILKKNHYICSKI
jgi:hypothetical protein